MAYHMCAVRCMLKGNYSHMVRADPNPAAILRNVLENGMLYWIQADTLSKQDEIAYIHFLNTSRTNDVVYNSSFNSVTAKCICQRQTGDVIKCRNTYGIIYKRVATMSEAALDPTKWKFFPDTCMDYFITRSVVPYKTCSELCRNLDKNASFAHFEIKRLSWDFYTGVLFRSTDKPSIWTHNLPLIQNENLSTNKNASVCSFIKWPDIQQTQVCNECHPCLCHRPSHSDIRNGTAKFNANDNTQITLFRFEMTYSEAVTYGYDVLTAGLLVLPTSSYFRVAELPLLQNNIYWIGGSNPVKDSKCLALRVLNATYDVEERHCGELHLSLYGSTNIPTTESSVASDTVTSALSTSQSSSTYANIPKTTYNLRVTNTDSQETRSVETQKVPPITSNKTSNGASFLELIKDLSIDIKSTSKARRMKTSASDNRLSSFTIGTFGIVIIVVAISVVVVMDLGNVSKLCKTPRCLMRNKEDKDSVLPCRSVTTVETIM